MKYCSLTITGRKGFGTKRLVGMVGNSWCPPDKLAKILNLGRTKHGHEVRGTHVYNSGVNYSVFCFGEKVTSLFVSYDDDTKSGTCVLWANVQDLPAGHDEEDEHMFWTVSFMVDDAAEKVEDKIHWFDYNANMEDGLPAGSDAGSALGANGAQAPPSLSNFMENSWFCRMGRGEAYLSLDKSMEAASAFIFNNVVAVARDARFPGTKVHAQFYDADLRNVVWRLGGGSVNLPGGTLGCRVP